MQDRLASNSRDMIKRICFVLLLTDVFELCGSANPLDGSLDISYSLIAKKGIDEWNFSVRQDLLKKM